MNTRCLIISLLVVLLCAACGRNSEPPQMPRQLSKAIFEGQWVRADYVKDLAATRSPYSSAKMLEGIATILIDTTAMKGDSVEAGASWNNHEGYAFTIYFDQQMSASSLATSLPDPDNGDGSYALGYRITGADTTLKLYHINRQREITDSASYIRTAHGKADDPTAPIQYMVNRLLFAGTYTVMMNNIPSNSICSMYDSAGHEIQISLNNDGKIKGNLCYIEYYVETDFNGDPETGDHIIMKTDSNENGQVARSYAFINTGDSIKLIATTDDPECGRVKGKVSYILKRQK